MIIFRPALLGLCATLSLFTGQTLANEAGLNLGTDAIHLYYDHVPAAEGLRLGGGYIYRDEDTHIFDLQAHAQGQTVLGNMPVTVGIGAQYNYFDEENFDGSAIAVGGFAHLKLPAVPGLGLRASLHYAPTVTSFGDADEMLRSDVRVTYRVIQNAEVYAGFRSVRTGIDGRDDISLDDSAMLGFTLFY